MIATPSAPVVVTGARGFLGRHVVRSLERRGQKVRAVGRQDGDLRDPATTERLLAGAATVVHLAADVGGVGYLKSCPGRAFHDNYTLGLNVIRAALRGGVGRLVLAGTPCSYSGDATLPLTEDALRDGVPSGDTGTYGYAKLATSLAAATLCAGQPTDTVTVIPSNLYGPGDAFDEKRGHVVAALIRKAVLAAELDEGCFEVWGDGSATRDFVYVADVAEGIAAVATAPERFDGDTFNLGSGRETSIREIASIVATTVGNGIRPLFLTDKPVGYTRRVMSVDHAEERLGYVAHTPLSTGIRQTVDWLRASGHVAAWVAAATEAAAAPPIRRAA
jgi:GDP-L-fucose synthase